MVGYLIFIALGVAMVYGGIYSWMSYRKKLASGTCMNSSDKKFAVIGVIVGPIIGIALIVVMIVNWIKDASIPI